MGFTGASVGKKSEDIDVYSSFVTNFLSNACWDVQFDEKNSREKLKAETSFLFALSNVARRHKMREVPHHKIYVWLLDIIRRDRSGSEQPLDDMNCIRKAVQILRDLFDANPNITWNSRKRELTTNIHAWTPLDSEERQGRDSANASLMSPRGKTSTTVGSLGASRGIADNEDQGQFKNTSFFVSTHHRRTGPREDWKSFVSLVEESMYTPEQIEKINRSSRSTTAYGNPEEAMEKVKRRTKGMRKKKRRKYRVRTISALERRFCWDTWRTFFNTTWWFEKRTRRRNLKRIRESRSKMSSIFSKNLWYADCSALKRTTRSSRLKFLKSSRSA